jgi:hypothetical protein
LREGMLRTMAGCDADCVTSEEDDFIR